MITLLLLLQLQILEPKVINHPLPVRKKEYRDTSRNYIVLHNDGGSGGYTITRQTLMKRRLSYHYYIKRDGTIVKLLDPTYQASHVGYSWWNGLVRINRYSIGICLQDNDKHTYTDKQYKSTAWLITQLRHRYTDSTTKRIVGHSNVARPRGRKTDPENFNWDKLNLLLALGGQHGNVR